MKISHLFKDTAIYGIATILPRLLNLILTPLHTSAENLSTTQYGIYQGLFAYMIMGNVLLTYGMETAFFRFINKQSSVAVKKIVQATALTSLFTTTSIFVIFAFLLRHQIASWVGYEVAFVEYAVVILALDTLAAIPFAWCRAKGRSIHYTIIKVGNVFVNLFLNLFFFLCLPHLAKENPAMWNWLIMEDKVHYIFISNLIASLLTLISLIPLYIKIGFAYCFSSWKQMFVYAFPVLVAGVAFSINEGFDRIFIRALYPADEADTVVGMYAGCYKLGVFMSLFITAYKLGVEPFFFSTATNRYAPETYAKVTQYFIIFGSLIFLFAGSYTHVIKHLLIPNPSYWKALDIVPVILLSNFCLGIYHSLSVWYKVTDRTWYGAYISIIGGIITIITNLLLIPVMGYFGSALATLLAYGSMMIISFWVGQKKYPIPYNLKKILMYLLTSTALTCINFYILGKNLIVGTIFVLLFMTMIFYLERKELLYILKTARKKK
ncbi:MAG: oligosaccharide flippase family protein [Capnocytophaga sp.]|nr:oligosaccharide flippase family protein [Capnocytophaga sp.]